jgi:hypothetical protein
VVLSGSVIVNRSQNQSDQLVMNIRRSDVTDPLGAILWTFIPESRVLIFLDTCFYTMSARKFSMKLECGSLWHNLAVARP